MKSQKLFLLVLGILLLTMSVTFVKADDEFSESKTTIGGYGELHYNYKKLSNETEGSKTLDFHRFVLFLSHNFSEKWSFAAELELEHNFVSEGQGELELEQAHINFHASEYFGFSAGVILPSIGLMNEDHDPPLFLSVERPDYNKFIIPTTWFGNGIAVFGNFKSLNYKFTIMEGLNSDGFSLKNGIRGGRQKGFNANAEGLLYNFSLNYIGFSGLKAGFSYSYNNAYGNSTGKNNAISIYEVHLKYIKNNIYFFFEFGNINYEKGDPLKSNGFYLDLGYNIGKLFGLKAELIPWIRLTNYNTVAEASMNGNIERQYKTAKWLFGIALKPVNNIIFKVEFGQQKNDLSQDKAKLINLGIGYNF